jgi:hypothetical protein
MIYSLTEIHFTSEDVLYEKSCSINIMIDSLIKNKIDKCILSISFDNIENYKKHKNEIDYLAKIYKTRIKVYIHYEQLTKFQHLEYLCEAISSFIELHDKIIFCDNDEILIELPQFDKFDKFEVIGCSCQSITGFTKDDEKYLTDIKKIYDLIRCANINYWETLTDFSGYICDFKLLKDFFEISTVDFMNNIDTIPMSLQSTEFEFVNYLEDFNIHKIDIPYVYRRVWSIDKTIIELWKINCISCDFDEQSEKSFETEQSEKSFETEQSNDNFDNNISNDVLSKENTDSLSVNSYDTDKTYKTQHTSESKKSYETIQSDSTKKSNETKDKHFFDIENFQKLETVKKINVKEDDKNKEENTDNFYFNKILLLGVVAIGIFAIIKYKKI